MRSFLQRHRSAFLLSLALVGLLFAKYFWSLLLFPAVPFGYDAGIYRYLFLKHAEAFPPFSVASMPPWALAHPLGLFFFSTIVVRLGVPVDFLIGWVWNAFPVILSVVFSAVVARKHGARFGLLLLLVSLLSTVQYEGFLMIYWKVFVALLWCVLAFDAWERKSMLRIPFGMMAIATHQQVGLVFVLATACSAISLSKTRKALFQEFRALFLALVFGALWYLPNADRALGDVLPLAIGSLSSPSVLVVGLFMVVSAAAVFAFPRHGHLLLLLACSVVGFLFLVVPLTGMAPEFFDRFHRMPSANPGAFLTIPEYLELSLPLLLPGLFGLFLSFRRERGTVWQWAAIVCVISVFSMTFFYRRFLLPMDFFLLPFAAWSLHECFNTRTRGLQVLGVALALLQGWLLLGQMRTIDPHVDPAMLREFSTFRAVVDPNAQVVVLDVMAPWVVGYLPQNAVSGPGIFDSQPLSAWEGLLYGSDADRRAFFRHYPLGTYFLATDVFRAYYPPEVQTLLLHPCLQGTSEAGLYRLVCDPA